MAEPDGHSCCLSDGGDGMSDTETLPFLAYSVGFCAASVCTSLIDEEATQQLNAEYPTGVGPWTISADSFHDDSPNPSPCPDYPGNRHILFEC